MGQEPRKGGTRLAQSGLGQTQIIGDLIRESKEGNVGVQKHNLGVQKWWKFEKQMTNFKAHNL